MSRKPASPNAARIVPSGAQRNRPGEPGGGGGTSTWRAIAPITAVAQGFLSGALQTAAQTRAPGFATRANSRAVDATSGKNMKPKRHRTVSKLASGKGNAP